MKYLLQGLLLTLSLIIVACFPPAQAPKNQDTLTVVRDYTDLKKKDVDREDTFKRSRTKHKASKECEGNDDCEDICDDIYKRRGDRNDCEELSITQVERLEELHENLEDPDYDDLKDIDSDDFDVYVNVSISSLDTLAGKWSSREVEDVLSWIADEADIAKVFSKEDDEYKIFKVLLERIGTGTADKNKYQTALKKDLEDDTFLGMAVVAQNENALEMVHEFLEEVTVASPITGDCGSNVETTECLRLYCDLAKAMDSDSAEELLDFDYFSKYLEDIIDDGINGATAPTSVQWDTDLIDDIGDLGNEWWAGAADDSVCRR